MAKSFLATLSLIVIVVVGCGLRRVTEDFGEDGPSNTETMTDANEDSGAETSTDTHTDPDTETDIDIDTETSTEHPFWIPDGEPLPEGPPAEWIWVPQADTYCRDGSSAGLSVRYSDTTDHLLIYLEGMGLCFSSLTCAINAAHISETMKKPPYQEGIFDFTNEQNPFRDWNVVYIPYCTGDCHLGSNPTGHVIDLGPERFVGGDNYRRFLGRIRATFPNIDQLFLIGFSGGAIGAAGNAFITSYAFGDEVKFGGISDGATVMRDRFFTPCLQKTLSTIWEVEVYLPEDCIDCFPSQNGSLSNIIPYVVGKRPDYSAGLISSISDSTVRGLFAFGLNDCQGGIFSKELYLEGLLDLRAFTSELGMLGGTYYFTDDFHGRLMWNTMYTEVIGGVSLVQWINSIIEGDTVHHVGP